MVMGRWEMHKKEIEVKGFKIIQIPYGVILDWIKAKFNKEEAILLIYMPKINKKNTRCWN
uniref:Uncharacterized protein n=1 Tax=Nelumbo nucifera TaxID=4432 RepID=A0A822XTW0_NELNU|nr:TPA_asm: hypothetical protein HUJ06_023992 [Nelumbo nucifera]